MRAEKEDVTEKDKKGRYLHHGAWIVSADNDNGVTP